MDTTFKAKDRFGAEMEFEIIEPTVAVENETDMQYKIAFNKAILAGLLPRDKMKEVMRENGIWGTEEEDSLKDVMGKLGVLQLDLQKAEKSGDKNKCINIAEEMMDLRNRMWQLLMIQQGALINSAEGMAETVRMEAAMAACVVIKASRQRYWESYKDYVLERDNNSEATVVPEAQKTYSNLEIDRRGDIVSEYPERKWIADYRDKVLEDVGLEDEATQVLNERKEKVVKKKTRKKTSAKKRVEVQADSSESSD